MRLNLAVEINVTICPCLTDFTHLTTLLSLGLVVHFWLRVSQRMVC